MLIFMAKTSFDGFIIRTLAELLNCNIKRTCCFNISDNGIAASTTDKNGNVLMDFDLKSENFSMYDYSLAEPMHIGIDPAHLAPVLSSIKKKDSLIMFIRNGRHNKLGLRMCPKDRTRLNTVYVRYVNMQHICIESPTNYGRPILAPTIEYQKMVKEMKGIKRGCNCLRVTVKKSLIEFAAKTKGVNSQKTHFGEFDESLNLEDEDSDTESDTNSESESDEKIISDTERDESSDTDDNDRRKKKPKGKVKKMVKGKEKTKKNILKTKLKPKTQKKTQKPLIQHYDLDRLARISKFSGLNPIMQIYTSENQPIQFRIMAGQLGTVSVFIKSREQIEDEANES